MDGTDYKSALDPVLKWPGGKRWFVRRYASFFSNIHFDRVVEPFAGALALSLTLGVKRALVNDRNHHLMNFYRQIQDQVIELDESYCTKEKFYQSRLRFNELIRLGDVDSVEGAKLFWYLNRWGFNGLCRFNKKGFFNVPYGSHKKAVSRDLKPYHNLMRTWDLLSSDFEDCSIQESDIIFCDPPYDMAFRSYCSESFNFDDQIRLVKWLEKFDVPIVITNHPTPRIVELYKDYGYDLFQTSAPRSISCRANGRKQRLELVATRHIPWKFPGHRIQ